MCNIYIVCSNDSRPQQDVQPRPILISYKKLSPSTNSSYQVAYFELYFWEENITTLLKCLFFRYNVYTICKIEVILTKHWSWKFLNILDKNYKRISIKTFMNSERTFLQNRIYSCQLRILGLKAKNWLQIMDFTFHNTLRKWF